jgi:replicative DNA helicase
MITQRHDQSGPPYRRAPFSLEAEQALLGAILINNDAHERVAGFLEPQHFFDELHAKIFDAAAKLITAGRRADPTTLQPFFASAEPIDAKTTVPEYLGRLAANATTIINARDYGRTIRDLFARRALIVIAEDVAAAAYDSPVDFPVKEQIEEAEARLYSLAESDKYGQGFVTFEATSAAALQTAANARNRDGGVSGIATGFIDLDAKMGGLQASDLIVLAGRPSMGKTALATNMAFNAARAHHRSQGKDGAIVGFFSLEMSAEQLSTRILVEHASIPSEKIRRGNLTEAEFARLADVQHDLAAIPLHIDETGGLSIGQLSARARRLKRQQGLGLIVVDYLQLMTGSAKRADGRVQEVTEITTGLKALAKELNVPVLALSQLSRAVEAREDKLPQLADLRESGSIEQDADVVLFVYREEYYHERLKPAEDSPAYQQWLAKMQTVAGRAEAIIGKQRHGPIGTIQLHFDALCTRFSSYANTERK